MSSGASRMALRISVVYAAIAGLWIFLSDMLLGSYAVDAQHLTQLQTLKGWGFILVTALALYFLIRHEQRQIMTADAARRVSEAHLVDVVNIAADAIITLDKERRIVMFNQGAEHIFGYRATDVLGQPLDLLLPPRVVDVHRQHISDFAATSDIARCMAGQCEVFGRRRDGSEFPAEANISKLVQNGQTIFTVILQDITQRKQAEQRLRESEIKFRTLAESMAAAIFIYRGGTLLYVNRQAETISGYTRTELLAMDFLDVVHPDFRELAKQQAMARREAEVAPARYEFKILTKNSEERWLDITAGTIEFEGALAGLGTAYDITERKRAEEALRKAKDDLEKKVAERTAELSNANSELEAFSYSVAHDLRAPLRAMQGFSQALLEDYGSQLDAVGQDYARRVTAAARRMDELIKDLLAYSHVSRAAFPLTAVDLEGVMAGVLAHLEAEIRERQARVIVVTSLPPVIGHYATLQQVMTNLLGNAIKFVPAGIEPQVKVWAEERGEWVRVWVEDNGIGIAPESQARIFRVFERLHGIEHYPGTGIGLAIVHKGIERMGGCAGVESVLDKGSRFWVELRGASSSS
ncbi:MAG: PAS domain S-box protein [Gammaproteobacteria bacterium]|nr:PAS domain S-box protein [Gammaproteobacteria bacterium]